MSLYGVAIAFVYNFDAFDVVYVIQTMQLGIWNLSEGAKLSYFMRRWQGIYPHADGIQYVALRSWLEHRGFKFKFWSCVRTTILAIGIAF